MWFLVFCLSVCLFLRLFYVFVKHIKRNYAQQFQLPFWRFVSLTLWPRDWRGILRNSRHYSDPISLRPLTIFIHKIVFCLGTQAKSNYLDNMKSTVSYWVLINSTGCFKSVCPFWNIYGKNCCRGFLMMIQTFCTGLGTGELAGHSFFFYEIG